MQLFVSLIVNETRLHTFCTYCALKFFVINLSSEGCRIPKYNNWTLCIINWFLVGRKYSKYFFVQNNLIWSSFYMKISQSTVPYFWCVEILQLCKWNMDRKTVIATYTLRNHCIRMLTTKRESKIAKLFFGGPNSQNHITYWHAKHTESTVCGFHLNEGKWIVSNEWAPSMSKHWV